MAASLAEEATATMVGGFARLHPAEVAGILEDEPIDETAAVIESMPAWEAAGVFQRLTPGTASGVLTQLADEKAVVLIQELETTRAASLLARLEEDHRDRLLAAMHTGRAHELRKLMSYPIDVAGHFMDPRVSTYRPASTVGQALQRLRDMGPGRRTYAIHMVDENGILTGVIPLQQLALAAPETELRMLTHEAPLSVGPLTSREEVVELLDRARMPSLPVVDFEGRLIGVIRLDQLVRAAEQEASADIQSMVGVSKEERALSKVSFAVRKRLPWLQINLATAFLAASVVGLFEDTIARVTALAVLLPVVAGQSGNTGAQALAVALRGLALREITESHWPKLVVKEFLTGLLNGIAVALVTMLGVYIWSGSAGLCIVIGSAMVFAMAIAGVAGAGIPVLLSALGQDPAQSSSIVLTTVTDVFGFFSFLGLATLFSALL
jgi:magnesium transporter